jgi:Tfp pilus assembly protein FimV
LAAVVALAVSALGAIAVVETVGALVDLGGRPAAASEIPASGSAPVAAPSLHVAAPGDTLWSIAEQYRGEVSRDRFVDALIDLNGGTVIQVGQPVRLP